MTTKEMFDRCVVRTSQGRSIRCRLKLWSVSAPAADIAEREAWRYWKQYYADGEYNALLKLPTPTMIHHHCNPCNPGKMPMGACHGCEGLKEHVFPRPPVWCVRHRDGWCILKNQRNPRYKDHQRTLCQYVVTLPLGIEKRRPTCPDCLKVPKPLTPGPAVWHRPETHIVDGKWATRTQHMNVRVMAVVEGYAMIRSKGCMPTVVSIKEVEQP